MKIKLLGLLLMFFAMTAIVACGEGGDGTYVEDDCDINPLDPGCQVSVEEPEEVESYVEY